MSSEIRNKMYNFEIDPPADSWNLIAAALDTIEADKRVSEKMSGLLVPPPAETWENIRQQLESPFIEPIQKVRYFTFRRLAAAAIFIGLIVTAVVYLNRDNPSAVAGGYTYPDQDVASSTVNPPASGNSSGDSQETVPAGNQEINTAKTANAIMALNRTNSPAQGKKPGISSDAQELTASSRSIPEQKPHNDNLDHSGYGILNNTIAAGTDDRYYNLLDENGNMIRVSKKLSSLDCIIKNGLVVPLDNASAVSSEECADKVKEWYKIMSSAPAITSPLDLLNVISTGG